MHGTYDPVTNAVTGTFTMEQEATGKLVYKVGTYSLKFALIWKGDVTGSVENNVAQLDFSGTDTVVCSLGGDDCGYAGTRGERVWFDVSNASARTVPGAPGPWAAMVSRATGDVYYSPADQADLEASARTWQIIKPGDRIAFTKGVMLRTGRNSSLWVDFGTGARMRLQPSTLFGVGEIRGKPSLWELHVRMFEGIASFYEKKMKEGTKKFEVETEMAILTIKGTTFEVAVTAAATVVTVAEGVVAVADKATGTTIDVGANERATVDAAGVTKTAAPDAAALFDENAPPATVSPGGNATPPPATSMASPAATATTTAGPASPQTLAATAPPSAAPESSEQAAGAPPPASPAPSALSDPTTPGPVPDGSGAPIGMLAAGLAGIGVVLLVAVGMRRRGPRR